MIIILTSRSVEYRNITLRALRNNGVRYNTIIFDVPVGERILINDEKPSGLKTAHSINIKRDFGTNIRVVFNSHI